MDCLGLHSAERFPTLGSAPAAASSTIVGVALQFTCDCRCNAGGRKTKSRVAGKPDFCVGCRKTRTYPDRALPGLHLLDRRPIFIAPVGDANRVHSIENS